MQSGSRFVDEFRADAAARGLTLPAVRDVGAFGDFDWRGEERTLEAIIGRSERDPDFSMDGRTRWVVFGRVCGEIRYWAAPMPEGARDWWWSPESADRIAATRAEPDVCELGILSSVADAVTFASEYLGGRPFGEISVPRTLHKWEPAAG